MVLLPLAPRSATYYLDYGSVLAAFAPVKPSNCDDAVRVLTQLLEAYGDDPVIVINAEDGLSICASVDIQPVMLPAATPPAAVPASITP